MSDGQESVRADSLTVSDNGRIRLPAETIEVTGIVDSQIVTLRLLLDDEAETFQKTLSGGRITIPHRIREDHGIEDGDSVDVEVLVG